MKTYCELVSLIARDDAVLTGKLLTELVDTLNRSIAVGNWRHILQGIRIILELEILGVIKEESVTQLGRALVESHANAMDSEAKSFIAWIALANAPFFPDPSQLFNPLNMSFEDVDLNNLVSLNAELVRVGWEGVKVTESTSNPNAYQLLPLDFGLLRVDPQWDPTFVYRSIFTDTFEPGNAPSILFSQWWTIVNLRMVLETYEINHPKLASVILSVPPESIGHPEKIVAEFLFGELIRTRHNGIKQVLYEVVLMDCCRITRLFPPIMARALLSLFKEIESLDAVQRLLLADWFAHHLSNFDFKWKWDEWKQVIDQPESNPQRIFVTFVIEKMLRLSYLERVQESLPDWAHPLLPPTTEPKTLPEDSLSSEILSLLQSRAPSDQVRELVTSNPDGRSMFFKCLLSAGSKTLSHVVILIERYLPVLQALHPKGDLESRIATVADIASFWETSPLHIEYILDRLAHYRIISAIAIISWMCRAAPMTSSFDLLVKNVLSWNILNNSLSQSRSFPDTITAKIDALPDEESEQRTKLNLTRDSLRQEWSDTLDFACNGFKALPIEIQLLHKEAFSKLCEDYYEHIIVM